MKDARSISELNIFRDGQRAGILRRTPAGCEFTFSEDFLQQQNFAGLCFCMQKSQTCLINPGVNLFPFFAGLLPEGLRLKSLLRNLKTSEDDLFSMFASIGDQVIGDVYAGIERSVDETQIPKLREINFYEYFQKVLSGSAIMRDEAIAGAQEKLSASMISFPVNIAKENCRYILKLNPPDKPNLVENEHFCMELARKCGIETARTSLVRDRDGNNGLLVTRFDRVWNEKSGRFLMHHQEDACQMLDRYPADKYRVAFNDIVRGIMRHVAAAKVAILRLIEVYAFSYLVGNGDLHAKNLSLLVKSGSRMAEVSPAYDLLCTYIYGDHKMALKLDGRDDNLKRHTFVDFAGRFGVSEAAVSKMLDRLTARFCRYSAVLQHIPMTEKQRTQLEKVTKKRLQDLSPQPENA